jgi:hypothetical protein
MFSGFLLLFLTKRNLQQNFLFQVLMLGASDVGKSLLTSQFMSSNDVTAYNNDEQIGEQKNKLFSLNQILTFQVFS